MIATLTNPKQLATILVALAIALLAVFLIPGLGEAVAGFIDGVFGGRRNFNFFTTLGRTSLIVGMALSVLVAFRAGLLNIGGEGQLVLGGLVAALVGSNLQAPPLVIALVAAFCAMSAAALWAMLAGSLDRIFGVPLLVGSLLLNYPARFFASYMVAHPFRDVPSGMIQSHKIDTAARLPRFEGTILDYGIVLIALLAVAIILADKYTVMGYRLRMQGISFAFARASGFPSRQNFYGALALSGAIAGLVGFIAVFGLTLRYTDGMLVTPLYAWTGIIAVLLAGGTPWLVPIAGFFFAALQTGAAGMERAADVPREVAQVIQGLVILLVAAMGHTITADRSGQEY